ncbi:MAG: PASTA domain-containing protein, partial [Caldithrix sp.]|nr:PASTA domain-containing protein [Caldithrix sp.]
HKGEILAMANYPTFDPNSHKYYSNAKKRNRTITDVFEPGSTQKLFTAAMLLQENLKRPNDIVFCEQGRYKIYDRYFRDTKAYGWMSFRRVFEKSSNIGFIKLSEPLNRNRFFKYLKQFGFGSKTGVGLAGEATGLLEPPNNWSGVSKASISIGYEIGVTALQLATAYSAIVNGGYLYRPYVVKAKQAPDGSLSSMYEPLAVRQVLSKEACDILRSFMKGVVEEGTGTAAKPASIEVGGKTGTARKYNKQTGEYANNRYRASFVGFAGYENPRYVCAVIIDDPDKGRYGGQVAAPAFRNIIQRIMYIEGHERPDKQAVSDKLQYVQNYKELPSLNGFDIKSARQLLDAKGYQYRIKGNGSTILSAWAKNEIMVLQTGEDRVHLTRMPDLKGLSKREAMSRIDFSKLKVLIKGQGLTVQSQSIEHGQVLKNRKQVVLTCR